MQGKPDEVAANVEALKQGRSMLDFVGDQSQRLNRSLSKGDQQRMDQYFTSVRELEQRLHSSEAWEYKPKPVVNAKAARRHRRRQGVRAANATDLRRHQARAGDRFVAPHHAVHRHDGDPQHHAPRQPARSARRAARPRRRPVRGPGDFLKALSETKEEGQTLLDRTMVLYGTCMGSANSHSNVNLPVLLAGGGFKHGQHLAFDQQNNYPLTNLYRVDAAAPGHRDQRVFDRQGHHARAGNGMS